MYLAQRSAPVGVVEFGLAAFALKLPSVEQSEAGRRGGRKHLRAFFG